MAVAGKRLAKDGELLELADDEVQVLAELEHGRYNYERLSAGWQLGQRHVANLISPYLEPCDKLDDKTKQWDRDAVRNIGPALAANRWGVAQVASAQRGPALDPCSPDLLREIPPTGA